MKRLLYEVMIVALNNIYIQILMCALLYAIGSITITVIFTFSIVIRDFIYIICNVFFFFVCVYNLLYDYYYFIQLIKRLYPFY